MNLLRYIFAVSVFAMLASGCEKNDVPSVPVSSITIANVVIGGANARLGSNTVTILNINNNASANFTLPVGGNKLYVWPEGDSLHPYFNGTVTTGNKEIYSLFITGTPASPDTLLLNESIPERSDSSFGARFINLSPGSPAVKVTLSTSTTTSEFGNIGYKQVSAFKSYPALATNTAYTFQVRNASTDALITSITITGTTIATGIPKFKNISLLLRGVVAGSPVAGVTRVNHF
jgi:hypothetical protein